MNISLLKVNHATTFMGTVGQLRLVLRNWLFTDCGENEEKFVWAVSLSWCGFVKLWPKVWTSNYYDKLPFAPPHLLVQTHVVMYCRSLWVMSDVTDEMLIYPTVRKTHLRHGGKKAKTAWSTAVLPLIIALLLLLAGPFPGYLLNSFLSPTMCLEILI